MPTDTDLRAVVQLLNAAMSYEPAILSPVPRCSSDGRPFEEPDFKAALDVAAVVADVPEDALVAGMFFLAIQAKAKELNFALSVARERYVAFNFYPLRELIPIMVEGAKHFYSARSLREGLRVMGRAVPKALVASTVGKVVFGSAEGVHALAAAMAQTYAINLRPDTRAEVTRSGPNWIVVCLHNVHHFLDSHHVGIYEGVMLHSGTQGSVKIAILGKGCAEVLLSW